LNFGRSRIELARGGYKVGSVMNEMSIVPQERWPEPPFIAHWGEGPVICSLIVVGLYYKASVHSAKSSGSFWDSGSYHCAVAHRAHYRKTMHVHQCI
jgi:hypothetical protein